MTARGLIGFVSYIGYIYFRWVRVTIVRYGPLAVLNTSHRPKRAGAGVGTRRNPFGRAHGNLTGGITVSDLLARLAAERAAVA